MIELLLILCSIGIGVGIGVWIGHLQRQKTQSELSAAQQEIVRLNTLVDVGKYQKEQEIHLLKENFEQERKIFIESNETLKSALKRSEEEMREKTEILKKEFRIVANEILETKSTSLKKDNKEQLDAVLTPLKENIEKLGKSVSDTRISGIQQKEAIEYAIKGLMERTEKIGKDAVNLTKALKSNPKVQGDWGEMILERMLEESGLRKDEEYFIQENCVTEDGRNVRPDVVIRFPEKRCVIIDSKVSLTAYINYVNAEDEAERIAALSAHVASVREHINELATKDYSKVVKGSIGYVLMFIPNEGSYIAALEKDKELLNYAYRKRIIIISPSNLMMALQLAYNLWQSEKQSRNVEEIIRRSNLLYEKFVTFVNTFEKLGDRLEDVRKQYDSAFGTLAKGNGNLIVSFMKMKELGLTPKKDISTSMINQTEISDNSSLPSETVV